MTSTMEDGIGYCKGSRGDKLAQLQKITERQDTGASSIPVKPPPSKRHKNILEKMTQLEKAMAKDNFVKELELPMDKSNPDYGKPQAGTRTAERGKKALSHVHKEILELCEVIYLQGYEQENHTAFITFGDLFRMYTRISDKVVGILLRARKYGLVYFEPEMLFQGQNDDDLIFLAKPMQQIYFEFKENQGVFDDDRKI